MSGHEKEYTLNLQWLVVLVIVLSALVLSCGEQDDDLIAQTVDFSGKVALNNGTAIQDVNVNLKDTIGNTPTIIETEITPLDGSYRFEGLSPSTWYIIEASKTGYTFVPEQMRVYTNVNLTDADFEGTP